MLGLGCALVLLTVAVRIGGSRRSTANSTPVLNGFALTLGRRWPNLGSGR